MPRAGEHATICFTLAEVGTIIWGVAHIALLIVKNKSRGTWWWVEIALVSALCLFSLLHMCCGASTAHGGGSILDLAHIALIFATAGVLLFDSIPLKKKIPPNRLPVETFAFGIWLIIYAFLMLAQFCGFCGK